MREIGAFEAKNKLGMVLDWVEQGEEVIITRRGKAIARVIPNLSTPNLEKAQKAATRIRERAVCHGGNFDWQEWKIFRDEGRK